MHDILKAGLRDIAGLLRKTGQPKLAAVFHLASTELEPVDLGALALLLIAACMVGDETMGHVRDHAKSAISAFLTESRGRAEILRCPECGRILAEDVAFLEQVQSIECGPVHHLTMADGQKVEVRPGFNLVLPAGGGGGSGRRNRGKRA